MLGGGVKVLIDPKTLSSCSGWGKIWQYRWKEANPTIQCFKNSIRLNNGKY